MAIKAYIEMIWGEMLSKFFDLMMVQNEDNYTYPIE